MPKILAAATLLLTLGACAAPLSQTAAKADIGAVALEQALQAPAPAAYHKRARTP